MDLPIFNEVLAQSSHKQMQQHAVANDGGPPTLEDGELRRPLKAEELHSHPVAIDQVIFICHGMYVDYIQ